MQYVYIYLDVLLFFIYFWVFGGLFCLFLWHWILQSGWMLSLSAFIVCWYRVVIMGGAGIPAKIETKPSLFVDHVCTERTPLMGWDQITRSCSAPFPW